MKVKSQTEVAQSCLTPSDLMDCSPPGSSVHGIFQARVLEWVPLPSAKCSLGISDFLEEISSLSHSIVFFCFFALITEKGFLISPFCFWNSASNGYIFPFLLCLSRLFLAICKASPDNHFAFLHFFPLGMVLIPALLLREPPPQIPSPFPSPCSSSSETLPRPMPLLLEDPPPQRLSPSETPLLRDPPYSLCGVGAGFLVPEC